VDYLFGAFVNGQAHNYFSIFDQLRKELMVTKELRLRDFILRGEAIKLYKQYLRLVNAAPPHARGK
jgi:hypothetical protein